MKSVSICIDPVVACPCRCESMDELDRRRAASSLCRRCIGTRSARAVCGWLLRTDLRCVLKAGAANPRYWLDLGKKLLWELKSGHLFPEPLPNMK